MAVRDLAIAVLFCGGASCLVQHGPSPLRPGSRARLGITSMVRTTRPHLGAVKSGRTLRRSASGAALVQDGPSPSFWPGLQGQGRKRKGRLEAAVSDISGPSDGNDEEATRTSKRVSSLKDGSRVAVEAPNYVPGALPKFDGLDRTILLLSVPAIVNFMLVPLVGAADTFWVGKMGNAAALAGVGAASQIYSTTFWVLGFLPSVITPLVAQAYGAKDMQGVQRHIGEALFLSLCIGLLGCAIVTLQSQRLLSIVIPAGAPAMAFAVPYFLCRGLSFLPAMLSTVGFATFRGTLDTVTPLAISAFSNIFHILLLPVLIFNAGMGVVGAGVATVVSDLLSSLAYLVLLFRRGFVSMSSIVRMPEWSHLSELLKAGFSVQLRTLAMNSVFVLGAANIQALDLSGTAAAAHTITTQMWSMGGTVLLALSTVAAILVPRAMASSLLPGHDLREAQTSADRMLVWGLLLGCLLAALQLAALPMIAMFTPLIEVQEAARLPFIIASIGQVVNGVTFVGEGIMQGHRAFLQLAVNTALSASVMFVALKLLGSSLAGVWLSFMVFNLCRFLGAMWHHFMQGPLALHKRR